MLDSAETLIRERGASGTSIDDVLAHSGAPRGSIYHHFPAGRTQILRETVERAGTGMTAQIAGAEGMGPLELFDAFLAIWRERLERSDFRAGCPVLAVAVESGDQPAELTAAAADAFASWRDALASLLRGAGCSPAEGRRRATLVVAAIEGAVALARVEHDLRPLDDVAYELRRLLMPPGA
jgi:AcrR family transcriptional regulator